MRLTDEEVTTFNKIIGSLQKNGLYAPEISIINLSEREKQMTEEKMKRDEEKSKKILHALGQDRETKTALAVAFEKASEKKT